MRDGEALLQAILAAPEDDCARLVYADWLEENGQGERAEFIRVQCDLAKPYRGVCRACGRMLSPEQDRTADGCPCNSPRGVNHGLVPAYVCTCPACDPAQTGGTRERPADVDALRRREREMLDRADEGDELPHRVRWLPFPEPSYTLEGLIHPTWERGFVSAVTLPCAAWLAHGPALVRRCPLRPDGVRLSDREPAVRDGECVWYCQGNVWEREAYRLPSQLFDALPPKEPEEPGKGGWTREEALAAASLAAYAWAKETGPEPGFAPG